MARLEDLTITGDGRVETQLFNSRSGKTNNYDCHAYGNFGSGTVTIQVSPDGGTTWIDVLDEAGAVVTFAAANGTRKITVNSDATNPVVLGFSMASSTTPVVAISIFTVD